LYPLLYFDFTQNFRYNAIFIGIYYEVNKHSFTDKYIYAFVLDLLQFIFRQIIVNGALMCLEISSVIDCDTVANSFRLNVK